MKNLFFALRALTPLHCGVGQGLNDIDLPTARHPVSGHPLIPGSSLKGVFKYEFTSENGKYFKGSNDASRVEALFGGDGQTDNQFASAISMSDATVLALPVRSFYGTFAYLASSYTLECLKDQLVRIQHEGLPAIPQVSRERNGNFHVLVTADTILRRENGKVLLEELDLVVDTETSADAWADVIDNLFFMGDTEGQEIFKKRFAIVDDDVLNFIAETSLPVDAHIAIDERTGTVKPGALWYEETVAPESLFTGMITVSHSMKENVVASAEELTGIIANEGRIHCQIGGKATTGKGFVAIDFHRTVGGA